MSYNFTNFDDAAAYLANRRAAATAFRDEGLAGIAAAEKQSADLHLQANIIDAEANRLEAELVSICL